MVRSEKLAPSPACQRTAFIHMCRAHRVAASASTMNEAVSDDAVRAGRATARSTEPKGSELTLPLLLPRFGVDLGISYTPKRDL
jgi:hypothetical protein